MTIGNDGCLGQPDLGMIIETPHQEGTPQDSADRLFDAFAKSNEVPKDPDFMAETFDAMHSFYAEYITKGGSEPEFPESMQGQTPTMCARLALWGRFKYSQAEYILGAKREKREKYKTMQKAERTVALKKEKLEQIKQWERTSIVLAFNYRNGSFRRETLVDPSSDILYDGVEQTLLELDTIFSRMYLEVLSDLDLNPEVEFDDDVQEKYTQAYISGGYNLLETREMEKNSGRLNLVKKRTGTRFGQLIRQNKGISHNRQNIRQRGRTARRGNNAPQ